MGYRLALLARLALVAPAILLGAVLGGCGKEIGDACSVATDCSTSGDRLCSLINAPDGYCTIQGCDYSTCPDEAACIRFFTGSFANKPCTQATAATDCSRDELCSLAGQCVARSSEVRYCMRTCGSDGDCRDGYECRDVEKMKAHGGEPVLAPGTTLENSDLPSFCAAAPSG
ncbi:MAG TPA: hypothetical protein VFT22_35630 [Kofleriaceae bacterium]|nr:hypothetical protein [Kofleriaceae bacterium]